MSGGPPYHQITTKGHIAYVILKGNEDYHYLGRVAIESEGNKHNDYSQHIKGRLPAEWDWWSLGSRPAPAGAGGALWPLL